MHWWDRGSSRGGRRPATDPVGYPARGRDGDRELEADRDRPEDDLRVRTPTTSADEMRR